MDSSCLPFVMCLPSETKQYIFSYLTSHELIVQTVVSKEWNILIHNMCRDHLQPNLNIILGYWERTSLTDLYFADYCDGLVIGDCLDELEEAHFQEASPQMPYVHRMSRLNYWLSRESDINTEIFNFLNGDQEVWDMPVFY